MDTITVQARELGQALTNVVQFVSDEPQVPGLSCVQMQYQPGELLVVASDRCTIATHRMYAETSDTGSVLVEGRDVRRLVKTIKSTRATHLRASVSVDEYSVRLSLSDIELMVEANRHEFPEWGRHFTTNRPAGAGRDSEQPRYGPAAVALNARHVARLAKVEAESGTRVALRMPAKHGKPVMAVIGDFTALLMPLSLDAWPWDEPDWQPPTQLPCCRDCGQWTGGPDGHECSSIARVA